MRGIATTGSNARCARRAPPPLPSRPSRARKPCQAERFGWPTIAGARVPCWCPSGGAHGRDPRDRAAPIAGGARPSVVAIGQGVDVRRPAPLMGRKTCRARTPGRPRLFLCSRPLNEMTGGEGGITPHSHVMSRDVGGAGRRCPSPTKIKPKHPGGTYDHGP